MVLGRKELIKLFIEHRNLRKRQNEIENDVKELVYKLSKDYSTDYGYPSVSIETFNRLVIEMSAYGYLHFGLIESLANYFEVTPTIHADKTSGEIYLMFDFQENQRFKKGGILDV